MSKDYMQRVQQAKPLYRIVADSLLEKITNGEMVANERLPSESELGKIYNVGRNTVRHALSDLVNRGALITLQGVGTFVADGITTKTAEFLYGYSQEMAERGKKVTSQVLEAKLIEADAFLSRRLQIQLGAEVVFLYRLRMIDGEPTALERAYLPHALCPGILNKDFTNSSLYHVLSTEYNRKPHHAEQEIEGHIATPEVARLLDLESPAVVLIIHRETHLADGQIIEYVDSELRADRFRFYTQLKLHNAVEPFVFQRMPVSPMAEKNL
ncbi:MAG: GntR family transcriptional regulator [Chloroflexota bacterium]